ncbi:MAG: PorP/SprF family type IX secretion system membrane protein [Bacteroidales bacterium]|nr:PorP/SprF family type IX secretion system membrane protein [Bacteroidales bacterium]
MKYFIAIVFIFTLLGSNAQDIHFSQYFYSPLTLNPAHTGKVDADWRFVNNFRNQWKSLSIPYRTIGVSYEHQWYIYSEQLSYGINIINDKSGPIGLTVNKLFLTLAYHKKIEQSQWHAGIQAGMVFKNFSLNDITFPNQFDMTTGYFNSQLNNNETNLVNHTNYPDINIGIAWDKPMQYFHPEIGLSVFHLIMPKETYTDQNYHIAMRYALYGGLFTPIKQFYFKPQVFNMRQRKATDLIIGSELGYQFKNNKAFLQRIFTGIFFRNDFSTSFDASIVMIGLQIKQWQFGFSYDINTSSLSQATQRRGAFELSVIYTSKSTIPKKITIPCDRM